MHEAAGAALVPERLAAAAEIVCLTRFNGAGEGFGIHVAHHQQLATDKIRGDRGQQALRVKFRRELPAFLDLLDRAALGEHAFRIHPEGPFVVFRRGASLIRR